MSSLSATSIGENAFKEKFTNATTQSKSVSIKLPANLKNIEKHAFSQNEALRSVEFNESLENIKEGSFLNSGLSGELKLPEHLQELGEYCFRKNKLTSVKIPDYIKTIRGHVFADNEIITVDFGRYEGVNARRWGRDTGLAGNMIAYAMFLNNKIEQIKLPDNIWAIGQSAFAKNDLKELSIPSNIKNIYFYGFYENPNLKNLVFETREENGKNIGIVQIDRGSFQYCSIEGHLQFPDSINEMGGCSFANNKISSVSFGTPSSSNSYILGYNSFENNPIESIENLDSYNFESEAFLNTKTLKNISFDYATPHAYFKYIESGSFNGGLLRSINIPSYIKNIYSDAFSNNTGWTKNTSKVALYRVDSDGVSYVTDNSIDDSKAKDYIFNPVLVQLNLKDKDGNNVAESSLPQSISVERTRNSTTESISEVKLTDYENFKLGDEITFEIPVSLKGYKLSSAQDLTKLSDNKYKLSLDPTKTDIVKDERYVDDLAYNVAYKKSTIDIKYEAKAVTVNFNFEKELQDGTKQSLELSKIPTIKYTSKNTNKTEELKNSSIDGLLYGDSIYIEMSKDTSLSPNESTLNLSLSGDHVTEVVGQDRYETTVTLTYKDTPASGSSSDNNGGNTGGNINPPTTTPVNPTKPIVDPTKPVNPPVVKPTNPSTTPSDNNTDDDNSTTDTGITNIPGINPPINVPFVPNRITNSQLIPNTSEDPVFTIINPEDTPLGNAKISVDEGTYTFIDEDKTPLGVAKIHDDNSLEILEVFDDDTPLSLPKTGQESLMFIQLLGAMLVSMGFIYLRKKNK